MEATELREQLCAAITRRSLVMFEYSDLIRVVEPHRFGINSAGHEMLSGWLRAGYSRSDPAGGWRNYLLSDVSALQVLDAPFAGTRPGYAAHDPRMREVFCELALSEVDAPAEGPFIVREPAQPKTGAQRANDDSRDDAPRADLAAGAPLEPLLEPPMQNAARDPVRAPVEAARTRDGEIDSPEAMP